MGRRIFKGMLKNLDADGSTLADTRREGFDIKYQFTVIHGKGKKRYSKGFTLGLFDNPVSYQTNR